MRKWIEKLRFGRQGAPEPEEAPEPIVIDRSRHIQELLNSAPPTRRDAPLTDVCLHDSEWEGGRLRLGCRRAPTSNRLLCGRHAAQHDRIKRDRARKKRARAQRRKQ